MISPASSPQYFGGSTTASANSTSSSKGVGGLGEDAFLTLLVAQLKHQDPMSPMQPYEMAAQLAQFTSVEQLTKLNTAVATQTSATQTAATVSQTALSAALIGRQVVATGDQVEIPKSGSAKVLVDVAGASGSATLTLKDDSGAVIATRDLGQLSTGTGQTLALPADLPPGKWHYSISVKNTGTAATTVTTYTTGTVTGVDFQGSTITLMVGGLPVSLGDLVQVTSGTTSSTGSSGDAPVGGSGGGGPGGSGGVANVARSVMSLLSNLRPF